MVVADGNLIILKPVPSRNPPQEPEYQYQSAEVPNVPPVIVNNEELPSHISAGLAEIDEGRYDKSFTLSNTLPQTE